MEAHARHELGTPAQVGVWLRDSRSSGARSGARGTRSRTAYAIALGDSALCGKSRGAGSRFLTQHRPPTPTGVSAVDAACDRARSAAQVRFARLFVGERCPVYGSIVVLYCFLPSLISITTADLVALRFSSSVIVPVTPGKLSVRAIRSRK